MRIASPLVRLEGTIDGSGGGGGDRAGSGSRRTDLVAVGGGAGGSVFITAKVLEGNGKY